MAMPDIQRFPLKLCLIKYEVEFNIYNFKNLSFLILFLYKSDLRISADEKQIGIIRIKH